MPLLLVFSRNPEAGPASAAAARNPLDVPSQGNALEQVTPSLSGSVDGGAVVAEVSLRMAYAGCS
jgi:hypothetical protein